MLENWKQILEKSGIFVSPEKWEPYSAICSILCMGEIHRQTVYKPIDFSLPNYCIKQFRIAVSVTLFIFPDTRTLHQITS